MESLVLAVLSGTAIGGVYALMGLGFVLAFRATATFNFAHAEMMILAPFLAALMITTYDFPTAAAMVCSLLLMAVVGAMFYFVVLQRMVGLPHWMGFVASLGLASVIQGALQLAFGVKTYQLDLAMLPEGVVDIAGARVSQASIVVALGSFALGVAIVMLMRMTNVGIAVRAAGQDPHLAAQGGINVRWAFVGSWAAAAVLAGIAGIVYTSQNIVSLEVAYVAWAAIPAAMLGGLDSIEGVLVGGLLIGLLQGFTVAYIGGGEVDVVMYSLLFVLLLVRPQGIFGTEAVTRV